MRVGIIAEGPSDVAVLRNVLKGAIGLDREFTTPLRPELHRDETDLQGEGRFSNWGHVRDECLRGEKIAAFLASPIEDGPRWVIVHIDAAEAALYGVPRGTDRSLDDVGTLHDAIAAKIREWIGAHAASEVDLAIAIEATDAWVLPIYLKEETDRLPRPKERLVRELNRCLGERERKRLFTTRDRNAHAFGDEVSAPLRKRKELERVMAYNVSLARFVDSLRRRMPPSG